MLEPGMLEVPFSVTVLFAKIPWGTVGSEGDRGTVLATGTAASAGSARRSARTGSREHEGKRACGLRFAVMRSMSTPRSDMARTYTDVRVVSYQALPED